MSTEFRPRKLNEYARIALKRKWMIILPTLAIGLAIGFVVFRLPDIYESATLIVVKSSTLPNSAVPMMSEEALTRELANGAPINVELSLRTLLAQDIGLMVDGILLGNTAASASAPLPSRAPIMLRDDE